MGGDLEWSQKGADEVNKLCKGLKESLADALAAAPARYDCMTCLHWAAHNGDAKVVEVLLSHRADLHAVDSWHNSALHVAMSRGHAAAAKTLVSARADIQRQNLTGGDPVRSALMCGFGILACEVVTAALCDANTKRDALRIRALLQSFGYMTADKVYEDTGAWANCKEDELDSRWLVLKEQISGFRTMLANADERLWRRDEDARHAEKQPDALLHLALEDASPGAGD